MSTSFSEAEVRTRIIEAVRVSLRTVVTPELSSDRGRTEASIIDRLLEHLASRDRFGDEDSPNRTAEISSSQAESSRRLRQRIISGRQRDKAALLSYWEQATLRLVAKDPDAALGVNTMYRGGRKEPTATDSAPRPQVKPITPETLTAYMRSRFPEQSGLQVEAVSNLPGGFSKETMLVTLAEPLRERFVIRKDMLVNPTERSVASEYPLLRSVWEAGAVPIAKPLWLETSPQHFGTALMAVGFSKGSGDPSRWGGLQGSGKTFATQLAKALAHLHTMPIAQTLAERSSAARARDDVVAEIEHWYSSWQRWKVDDSAMLDAVFTWLRENIPEPRVARALVHGDIGFHNLLIDEGQLTAILDWEYAHLGDPAEDVAYCRPFVEQVSDWDTFLETYEQNGGTPPPEASGHFYSVWQSARNAVSCVGAQHAFLSNAGADAKIGMAGLTYFERYCVDAFGKIVTSAQ